MKAKKEMVELFCTGTHFGKGNNVRLIGFIIVKEGQLTSRSLYYSYSKFNSYVGHIYKVEMSDEGDGVIMHGRPEYVRTFEDEAVILEHRLESESNDTIFLAVNQAKKAVKEKKDILNCLKPIRQKWRNTNTLGQVALEARVLYYLRTGGDL